MLLSKFFHLEKQDAASQTDAKSHIDAAVSTESSPPLYHSTLFKKTPLLTQLTHAVEKWIDFYTLNEGVIIQVHPEGFRELSKLGHLSNLHGYFYWSADGRSYHEMIGERMESVGEGELWQFETTEDGLERHDVCHIIFAENSESVLVVNTLEEYEISNAKKLDFICKLLRGDSSLIIVPAEHKRHPEFLGWFSLHDNDTSNQVKICEIYCESAHAPFENDHKVWIKELSNEADSGVWHELDCDMKSFFNGRYHYNFEITPHDQSIISKVFLSDAKGEKSEITCTNGQKLPIKLYDITPTTLAIHGIQTNLDPCSRPTPLNPQCSPELKFR